MANTETIQKLKRIDAYLWQRLAEETEKKSAIRGSYWDATGITCTLMAREMGVYFAYPPML